MFQTSSSNNYEKRFDRYIEEGRTPESAAVSVLTDYLDGKPSKNGTFSAAERCRELWESRIFHEMTDGAMQTDEFVLTLTEYFRQDEYTGGAVLMAEFASKSGAIVLRAARYSGILVKSESKQWPLINALAERAVPGFAEFVRDARIFQAAWRARINRVDGLKAKLANLSPLDVLCLASMYAFRNLDRYGNSQVHLLWQATTTLFFWSFKANPRADQFVSEFTIVLQMRETFACFLYHLQSRQARQALAQFEQFSRLIEAEIELQDFNQRSVEAYCYDDSIEFVYRDGRMEIVLVDEHARQAWKENEHKLERFASYWNHRAMQDFVSSPDAGKNIRLGENYEENLAAVGMAMGNCLRLQEVYGFGERISIRSGGEANLYNAMIGIELMAAYYRKKYIGPYEKYLKSSSSWQEALFKLSLSGSWDSISMEIVLPITFSRVVEKVQRIQPWTVSDACPNGDPAAAREILEFWSYDFTEFDKGNDGGIGGAKRAEINERPFLRLGEFIIQLPWMQARQNNFSSALNNFRRVESRRKDIKEETRRIENQLAGLFRSRGVNVLVGFHPPSSPGGGNPGEIDLICAMDGMVLVIEVKSSHLRKSIFDEWIYKTKNLRNARRQIERKVKEVRRIREQEPD